MNAEEHKSIVDIGNNLMLLVQIQHLTLEEKKQQTAQMKIMNRHLNNISRRDMF